MKACHSSEVICHDDDHRHHLHYQNHRQPHIGNVPRRLESESDTTATERDRKSWGWFHSNRNNKGNSIIGFRHKKLPLLAQVFICSLVLSTSIHPIRGSHLPTSYLVQKANSNSNSAEQYSDSGENVTNDVSISTTVADTSTTVPPVTESLKETTFEPKGTTSVVENVTTTTTDLPFSTASSTAQPSASSSSSPVTNSEEATNETHSSIPSEHDHYDEYAVLKAALEKEKSSEDTKPVAETKPEPTKHPYILQAADGRKYASLEAYCDNRFMTITGQFNDIFKGRIYADGYSDENECGFSNAKTQSHNVSFSLPLGSCGVQMMAIDDDLDNDLRHDVTLYIQYSAFLQQVVDEKISVSCTEVKKSPVEEFLASNEEAVVSSRQGRRMGGMGEAGKFGTQKISTRIGESWMEILAGKDPSPKSRKLSPVSVGEDVTIVISTKVLRGYDARIVNCSAHDGSRTGTSDGSRAQQILDSAGCSLDRSLVPNLRRRRLPIESRNRLITLHFATFQAFKFPERDHLHIKCAVAYCQGPCPQEPCDSVINHFGSWREKYGRVADVLIDSTEVVNSVEVVAPELEDLGRKDSYNSGAHQVEKQSSPSSGSYSSLSGGNSISPAGPMEISGRQFSSDQASSYSSYSSSNRESPPAPSASASAGPSLFGNKQGSLHQMGSSADILAPIGNSVCVSPGTVILALVVLGVVLVVSATATLWFALKRSEAKKYRHVKHSPFQPGPQPYYRFSHW